MENIVTHDSIQWVVQLLVAGVVVYLPKIFAGMKKDYEERIDKLEKAFKEKVEDLEEHSNEKDKDIKRELDGKWAEERLHLQRMEDSSKENHKQICDIKSTYVSKEDYKLYQGLKKDAKRTD